MEFHQKYIKAGMRLEAITTMSNTIGVEDNFSRCAPETSLIHVVSDTVYSPCDLLTMPT